MGLRCGVATLFAVAEGPESRFFGRTGAMVMYRGCKASNRLLNLRLSKSIEEGLLLLGDVDDVEIVRAWVYYLQELESKQTQAVETVEILCKHDCLRKLGPLLLWRGYLKLGGYLANQRVPLSLRR